MTQFYRILIFTVLVSEFLISTAHAQRPVYQTLTISCTAPAWVGDPQVGKNDRLEATLSVVCKIAPEKSGSIAGLNQGLAAAIHNTFKVNEGPTESIWQGLPGSSYDVTEQTKSNGNDVTIRSELKLVSDQTHLIYRMQSKEIQGNGDAKFLESVTEEIDVLQSLTETNMFTFTNTQTIILKRPWYAPPGIFVSKAKAGIMKTFSDRLKDLTESTSKQLETLAP